MKKLLLLSLPLMATSAFADYKVTLDIERPAKEPIIVTKVAPLNKITDFSSVKRIENVSAIETTTRWYHNLFGIKPTPVKMYPEIEVDVQGYFAVAAANKADQLLFSFEGRIVELLSMDTSKYDVVSFPHKKSSHITSNNLIQLENGSGCLKPFSSTDEYSISVCVDLLD